MSQVRCNPQAVVKAMADLIAAPDGDDIIGQPVAVVVDRDRLFTFHLITKDARPCAAPLNV